MCHFSRLTYTFYCFICQQMVPILYLIFQFMVMDVYNAVEIMIGIFCNYNLCEII